MQETATKLTIPSPHGPWYCPAEFTEYHFRSGSLLRLDKNHRLILAAIHCEAARDRLKTLAKSQA